MMRRARKLALAAGRNFAGASRGNSGGTGGSALPCPARGQVAPRGSRRAERCGEERIPCPGLALCGAARRGAERSTEQGAQSGAGRAGLGPPGLGAGRSPQVSVRSCRRRSPRPLLRARSLPRRLG